MCKNLYYFIDFQAIYYVAHFCEQVSQLSCNLLCYYATCYCCPSVLWLYLITAVQYVLIDMWLICCVVVLLSGKQQKLKELADSGRVKLRMAELQSQVSKLEQENRQLKQRTAKQLGTVSEHGRKSIIFKHVLYVCTLIFAGGRGVICILRIFPFLRILCF